jgi:hypothetical protein
MNMEGQYESANRQDTLTARMVGYTIILSGTNVAGKSFFIILVTKTTTFTYEIKHLDPLTQTLSLSITSNTLFHTLHGKCSLLQPSP